MRSTLLRRWNFYKKPLKLKKIFMISTITSISSKSQRIWGKFKRYDNFLKLLRPILKIKRNISSWPQPIFT